MRRPPAAAAARQGCCCWVWSSRSRSVALTFFAYLGFSVITFSVGGLRDPARELPQAMYLALGVTSVTYVLISIGVFGTLTVEEVTRYGETAIAEAARPALGDAGFVMIAIAALLGEALQPRAEQLGTSPKPA